MLEDARMRDIYERILAAGGAKVEDWSTIQRLNAEFMPNGVKLTCIKFLKVLLYDFRYCGFDS